MTRWHDDDAFWEAVEPVLFTMERMGEAARDARSVLELLGLAPPARILDLCAGPGRHAVELARAGFDVTAVDRTQRYVDRAGRAASEAGVGIEILRQDMRTFVREGAFDVVLNLFTSFGYFEDPAEDLQVARNILRSLVPGGRAVIDMYGKENLARDFKERDWSELDDLILLEHRTVSKDWSWIVARWIVVDGCERRSFTLEHRIYSGQELRSVLLEAGFESVDLYGSFEGGPYDHTAKRLVAVARAPGDQSP